MKRKHLSFSQMCKRGLSIVVASAMTVSMLPAFSIPVSAKERAVTEKPFIFRAGSIPANESTITQDEPFAPYTGGSQYFRIPALITLQNGDLLATADARWETSGDGGGLDTMASVSSDGGKTWNYSFPFFFPDSDGFEEYDINGGRQTHATTIIDPGVVEGPDGTIYCIADVNPTGSTTKYKTIGQGTGYVTVNGKRYLALTQQYDNVETKPTDEDLDTYPYYVGDFDENGHAQIFKRADSQPTGYGVDEWYNLYEINEEGEYIVGEMTQKQINQGVNLSQDNFYNDRDIQQNAFYKDSKFHVYSIGYMWVITSKDHGRTWEHPRNINDQVKRKTGEHAILVSPGKGITTRDGDILIGYYDHGGEENASLSWSSDNGETWGRSNDIPGAGAGGWWSSENEPVELEDGTIRMFFRNGQNKVCYADAVKGADGSYTMGSPVKTECDNFSGCNVTALAYSRKVNGKQAVLVGCPGGPGGRVNGKIFTFLIGENNSMTLASTFSVPDRGSLYNYSCLTELEDGTIGLLWETSWSDIVFDKFSMAELVPGADIEGISLGVEVGEGDEYTKLFDAEGNITKQPDENVATVEAGEIVRTVIPLYDHKSSTTGLTGMNYFSSDENANISLKDAEFTFTGSGETWSIKSEAKNLYLVNKDINTFFTNTAADVVDMKVVATSGQDTFRICRTNGQRYVIFYSPEMDFNANTNYSQNDASYELTLLEKQEEASEGDIIPGYKKVTSITSGRKYLITYIWDNDKVMVLYPQNGKVNQTRYVGEQYERRANGIAINGVGAGYTTTVVDGIQYEICVTGNYPDAVSGCSHSNTTLKGVIPAACTREGYTGDEVCDDCGGKVKSGESIPALGHSWDEGTVTKDVTRAEDGRKVYTCEHDSFHTKTEILYASAYALFMDAYEEAAPLAEKEGLYEEDTFLEMKKALHQASIVALELEEGKGAGRSDMYKSADALKAAKEGLVIKSEDTLKEELNAALQAAKADYDAGRGNLPDYVWEAFETAYNNAAAAADVSLEELCELINELTKAQESLTAEKDEQASAAAEEAKKALEAGVNEAKDIYAAGQGNYMDITWKAFADAYNAAVNSPESADAATLNNLLAALTRARAELKTKEEPVPTPGETVKIKAGDTVTYKNVQYKVLNADNKTVAAVKGTNKKAGKIVIASTVQVNGVTCKVVQVGANAFKGYRNIKQVTLGENVTMIGKQSFSNCKKLKKVIVKGTSLRKIKSGAFKKTASKMTVKVPKKMKKKQRTNLLKKMKQAGISKKAKIK